MAFVGDEGVVNTGIDTLVIQDGRIVSYATDMNVDEDYEVEGIRTLGVYGDRDFKSMGYTSSLSIGTFLLEGDDIEGELESPGWKADGTTDINTAGLCDFVGMNKNTLTTLFTAVECKIMSKSLQVQQRGFLTRQTNWKVRRVLPGLNTR